MRAAGGLSAKERAAEEKPKKLKIKSLGADTSSMDDEKSIIDFCTRKRFLVSFTRHSHLQLVERKKCGKARKYLI